MRAHAKAMNPRTMTPRTMNRVFLTALVAFAALCLAALPAAASDLWFHVEVQEHGGDNASIMVNLPISMVESALNLVDDESMRDGRIVIDDAEFDAARLRELWNEVRDTPDMTFVTVQSDNETINVYKERGYLVARTSEASDNGADVHARLPLGVVDALLSTGDDTLDLQAALQALVEHGEGELVTVTDGNSNVRVWIDRNPEATRRSR